MTTHSRFTTRTLPQMFATGLLALSVAVVGCKDANMQKNARTLADASLPVAASAAGTTAAEAPKPVDPLPPEPLRVVTYQEAEAAYHAARYEDAVDLFTRYIDGHKNNPWGYYMLGLSAWKDSQNALAKAAFEQALALDPSHTKSWTNLSRVLLDTGRPEDALATIDSVLILDPASNPGFRLLGRAYDQLDQNGDAVDAYRQALVLDEHDVWSMNNLALVYIKTGRYDEAVPALARATSLRDNVAIFYNNLGMALEHTGFVDAARTAYRTATSLDAEYAKALANLERIEGMTEQPGLDPIDLDAAAEHFAETIEMWRTKKDEESIQAPVEMPVSDPLTQGTDETPLPVPSDRIPPETTPEADTDGEPDAPVSPDSTIELDSATKADSTTKLDSLFEPDSTIESDATIKADSTTDTSQIG